MTKAIAVAQFAPSTDRAANLETMRELARVAVERGAGLVVYPEYSAWFAPQFGPEWNAAAEPRETFAAKLGQIAAEYGIVVVAGMLESTAEKPRNTVLAVDDSGVILASYQKLHLYDAFGGAESEWLAPGPIEEPRTFAWNGFTVGLQTCYDIRFPEVSRRLVDAGADLLLVPSEWVRGPLKEAHWRTMLTARAIENTVYLAAADHTPPVGVGTSMILDPMGIELAALGEEQDVAIAWPTHDRLMTVRQTNPALRLRRFRVAAETEPLL
jgi:deaminated glutathione amidase